MGWPAFVYDNFVEYGDFLNFFVDQDLHFLVLHYDHTCCPKDKSCAVHTPATTAPGASPSAHKAKKEVGECSGANEKGPRCFFLNVRPTHLRNLNIPAQVLKYHSVRFKDKVQIRTGTDSGDLWAVSVSTYSDGRLVLTGGWPQFTESMGVKVGHKCCLTLDIEAEGFCHFIDFKKM